jgi:hypothetical protein
MKLLTRKEMSFTPALAVSNKRPTSIRPLLFCACENRTFVRCVFRDIDCVVVFFLFRIKRSDFM